MGGLGFWSANQKWEINWWQNTLLAAFIVWVFWSNIHDESDRDVRRIKKAKAFKPSDYLPGGKLYRR